MSTAKHPPQPTVTEESARKALGIGPSRGKQSAPSRGAAVWNHAAELLRVESKKKKPAEWATFLNKNNHEVEQGVLRTPRAFKGTGGHQFDKSLDNSGQAEGTDHISNSRGSAEGPGYTVSGPFTYKEAHNALAGESEQQPGKTEKLGYSVGMIREGREADQMSRMRPNCPWWIKNEKVFNAFLRTLVNLPEIEAWFEKHPTDNDGLEAKLEPMERAQRVLYEFWVLG